MHRGVKMKKLLIILVCMFNVNLAFAGEKFLEVGQIGVQIAVRHYFPTKFDDVIYRYRDMLEENNNQGISSKNMWEICTVAGLDIKQSEDKRKCREFTRSFAKLAKGFNPCDDRQVKNLPSGINVRCEKELFANSISTSAVDQLAEEFAKMQTGNECSVMQYRITIDDNKATKLCISEDGSDLYGFIILNSDTMAVAQVPLIACRIFGGTMPGYDRNTGGLQICEGIDCSAQSPISSFASNTYGWWLGIGQDSNGKCLLNAELDKQVSTICFPNYRGGWKAVVQDIPESAFQSLEILEKHIENVYFNNWCYGFHPADSGITGLKCDKPVEKGPRVRFNAYDYESAVMTCHFMGANNNSIEMHITPPDNYSFETGTLITRAQGTVPPEPVLDDNIEIPEDDLIAENIPLDLGGDEPLRVEYITPPEPVLDDKIEIPEDDLIAENIPLDLGGDEPLRVEYITPPEPVLDDKIEIPEDDLIADNIQLDLGNDDPLRVEYITTPEPIVAESVDVESVVESVDVEPVVEPVVVPEPRHVVGVVTPTPTPDKPVTPYSVPENKSGRNALIATAAVLGAVGTGFLIGGLVGGGDDDENRNANVPSQLDEQLNTLMNNANGVLGRVDNNIITLARLQTLSGMYAPIVNISGRAVIAVIYAGHYLPYYMDASAGRWVPLLGIGNVGGWFNTYPQNPTGITVIDQITNILNQQLLPNTVRQFIGINATGAQFPGAATGAYSIINAEFPNGVVQSNSGTMSSGDQQLYDNNYQRIKNLFATAQLGGFFIV